MELSDKINFYGVFSLKALDENDNVIDEYTEKNLIMDEARINMAQLAAGVTTGIGDLIGQPINTFVIGTSGHVGTDILTNKEVGEYDFTSARTSLFSEADGGYNYNIPFDPTGGIDITTTAVGTLYDGSTFVRTDSTENTIRRVVDDRTITYTVTIPAACGNSGDSANPVIAYTEAALYAEGEIFSMKCFPARVKEETVKFIISWSIIF